MSESKDWMQELKDQQTALESSEFKAESLPLSHFFISSKELKEKIIPATEWFFDSFIPCPSLIGRVGRPGSYKTFFAHWIANRLSAGKDLFDETMEFSGSAKHTKTLIIEEEMGEIIVQEREKAMQEYEDSNVFWMINSGFNLRDEKKVDELVKIIAEKDIRLLILDPFSSISKMKDENSNAEAAEVMDILLNRFVNGGSKITVLFIHHPSKSSTNGDVLRGAGDILGKCYIAYGMDKMEEAGTQVRIKCIKHRWRFVQSFIVDMVQDKEKEKLKFVCIGKTKDNLKTKVEQLESQVMGILETAGGMSKAQISMVLERETEPRRDKNLGEAIKNLKESGKIRFDAKKGTILLK